MELLKVQRRPSSPKSAGVRLRESERHDSAVSLDLRSSLSIQPFEGSRFVRGGRYGISIDFGLEVVEKENTCGETFKSKFIGTFGHCA